MSVHPTFYQRLFLRDLFSLPIGIHARTTMVRRRCSDRICLLFSVLLTLYIGWYIFISPNRTFRFERDSAEEIAYKQALNTSTPILQNTQICSSDAVDLMFIIVSSSSHFLERQSIRETWGSMPDVFNVHSQRLFVIGYKPGSNYYKDISNEAKHERDILYLPTSDYSETLKELHAYRWLEKHCPNVIYTFKTEDDLFVNSLLLHELIKELKSKPTTDGQPRSLYKIPLSSLFLRNTNHFLFGWAYQAAAPERNMSVSPFYISYEEYPKALYPRYCSGFGYLMDSRTRNMLSSEGSNDKRPLRFSDIYITGILPERLSFVCEPLSFTFYQGTSEQCIKLIKTNNLKEPVTSSAPLIVCSTGRHTSQSSFSDYYKIWTALKQVYADRLQPTTS